jgi:hypothetical protein
LSLAAPTAAVPQGDPEEAGTVPGAHECVPGTKRGRGDAKVAWKQLENPVFALDHMTKDQSLRLVDGQWHLFFSERLLNDDESTRTGHWVSTDFKEWSPAEPRRLWGSPDITRAADGNYVLSHQLPHPTIPDVSRISYATAPDPSGPWSESVEFVPELFPGERIIDAAVAHTGDGLYLMFKRGLHESIEQDMHVIRSAGGSLAGPWEYLGMPDLPLSENFQFLVVDGKWHLLATRIPQHQPLLFRLKGDPTEPESWLRWKQVREFKIPDEDWNTGRNPGFDHEVANSSYLCDARELDGYWYLVYAGSTELETFDGRGHAKLGVARSKDLRKWEVP